MFKSKQEIQDWTHTLEKFLIETAILECPSQPDR